MMIFHFARQCQSKSVKHVSANPKHNTIKINQPYVVSQLITLRITIKPTSHQNQRVKKRYVNQPIMMQSPTSAIVYGHFTVERTVKPILLLTR